MDGARQGKTMTTGARIGAGLALCLALAFAAAPAEAAKKKKKGGGVFQQSQAVNTPIPDWSGVAEPATPVTRTITVPKRFKGRVVGDVNITGFQTTGNVDGAAEDLGALLSAPNGTVFKLFEGFAGQSLGPLTIDDDTRTSVCEAATPICRDPDLSLVQPYTGTANALFLGSSDTGPLSALNGSAVAGVWTLRIFDADDVGQTSVFNSWGLRIVPAKPIPPASGSGKKKKKGGSVFQQTIDPNAAIPDGAAAAIPSTSVRSTITVGKSFKGKVIGDLDLTGLRTTGSGAGAAQDLDFKLTAPNGRTAQIFSDNGDQSLGPLTLNDESTASICDSATPCADPSASLPRPFAGTANVIGASNGDTGPLSVFDGLPLRGTWTLSTIDDNNLDTNTLNSWGLRITSAKPPKALATGGGKGSAAAKNKTAKSPVFQQQRPVSIAVPQDAAAGASTAVESTITVGKQFKGANVGDLDLTGVATTGNGAGAADDLGFRLIAPNGNTAKVIDSTGDQSIGPLTLSDETLTSLCDAPTPTCFGPGSTLVRPFAGTANMLNANTSGTGPLSSFDGAPMRGTWTLRVVDTSGPATTSTLTSWGLKITPAKPVTG